MPGAPPQFRFTTFDLDSCIEVAKAVHDGGGQLSAAGLAEKLGYKSHNNGSFNTRLANARLFGLLDGPSSAIRPSDRAMAILHPDYPATAEGARLEAFDAVPLYRAVLDEYHGKPLPDEAGLRNALAVRWGITAEKAPAVLARLIDSAEQAGLFRTAGNRSKMIRPTPGGGGGHTPAPTPPATSQPPVGLDPKPTGARANKVIDGVLDELPPPGKWSEPELTQWLSFFEGALRVVYRLPKGAPSGGNTP